MTGSPVLGVVHVLDLHLLSPPIKANDRDHYQAKGRKVRKLRQSTAWLARANLPKITNPVSIVLVWTVVDRRRRDVDGSFPTAKAAIDGLVDAGTIPDDNAKVLRSVSCRIEQGDTPGVRLEITEETA